MDDSSMIDGLVFDQKVSKAAGGPARMENAKASHLLALALPPSVLVSFLIPCGVSLPVVQVVDRIPWFA